MLREEAFSIQPNLSGIPVPDLLCFSGAPQDLPDTMETTLRASLFPTRGSPLDLPDTMENTLQTHILAALDRALASLQVEQIDVALTTPDDTPSGLKGELRMPKVLKARKTRLKQKNRMKS